MKTTDKRSPRAAALLLAVSLFLPLLSPPGLAAAEPARPPRFFVGVLAGYFYPGQGTFRKIYDQPAWPIELQLGWSLNRKISVFGAVRYLATTGNTVLLDARQAEESYVLRWRQATLRLGVNYWPWPSRFAPFLGAGLSYSFYREQWQDAPLRTEGGKTGFFVQAGGRYRLGRRWHALAQLEYSFIPAGSGARGTVNLGGINLSLGLTVGIF